MALGKLIGQFSGKLISITLGPGPGTALTVQANMEGTGSGEMEGTTYALTLHVVYEPSLKSGTWSQYGISTGKDGTSLGFRGQGTWEGTGSNKWRYRGTNQISDGSTNGIEFEGDWATRTWAGKLYEWS